MKALHQSDIMPSILDALGEGSPLGERRIEDIACRLRIPSSRVYGFMSQFPELCRDGRRARIRVCTGPACSARGAWEIVELLKSRYGVDLDVLPEPGLMRWHGSPAVVVEPDGGEARLFEGLDPKDVERLVPAIEGGVLSSGKALKDALPPFVAILPGHEPLPWTASIAEQTLPQSWNAEEALQAGRHFSQVAGGLLGGGTSRGARKGQGDLKGDPRSCLICDLVGKETENGIAFAVALLHPRAVVAGASIAAAALGAGKLAFYVPWNDAGVMSKIKEAVEELLAETPLEVSIFRGPVHVPSIPEIGRAAVMQGLMLWQAAALYSSGDTASSWPPMAVLPADLAWKLPWAAVERGDGHEDWAGSRLISVSDGKDASLVEVPHGMAVKQALEMMGWGEKFPNGGPARRGEFLNSRSSLTGASAANGDVSGEVVLVGASDCIPAWVYSIIRSAESGCCGGCTPGRTLPGLAGRALEAILGEGRGEEVDLEKLEWMVEKAAGLALCPRLGELMQPAAALLRGFRDEFEAHCLEDTCKAGSCHGSRDPGYEGE